MPIGRTYRIAVLVSDDADRRFLLTAIGRYGRLRSVALSVDTFANTLDIDEAIE